VNSRSRRDIRLRLTLRRSQGLQIRLAQGMTGDQRFAAFELRIGVDLRGLGMRKLRFRLRQLRGEGPGVDLEQQLPFGHHLPVAEVDGLQQARHAGANLNRFDGLETAGVIVPLGDLLMQRMSYEHRRRGVRRRSGAAAAGEQPQHHEKGLRADRGDCAVNAVAESVHLFVLVRRVPASVGRGNLAKAAVSRRPNRALRPFLSY
jgi:hypothetical protein